MDKHWFGELILNLNPPPSRPTGLVMREGIYKKTYIRLWGLRKRYFIFMQHIGAHDYWDGHEERCGSYTATTGYWHYATEKERDDQYEGLLKAYRFEDGRLS